MGNSNKNWLDFLHSCADKTDEIAKYYFQKKDLKVSLKENKTPLSQADQEIEQFIRSKVKKEYSELEIFAEEFGQCSKDAKLKLIIDPIDGTINFIRGIPIFATLLAIEIEGEIIAGLVSAPQTSQRWWAAKGIGSYYNGKVIQVSKISDMNQALAFHGSLFGPEAAKTPKSFLSILKQTHRQRGVGDYYSHVLVAMGCGEFALDFGFQPWDIAPLKVINEEAGGIFSDAEGKQDIYSGSVISSNGLLHQKVLDILNT